MIRLAAVICLLLSTLTVAGQSTADLILINGNVRTLDKRNPRAQAVAISAERITAVGSNAAVRKLAGSATRVIDAGGRLVLPGFNDAHVHLTGVGNFFSHLNISEGATATEITATIARFTRALPNGRWVLGRGWRATGRLPTVSALDAVSRDNPVLIYSKDYSLGIANSQALKLAGVVSQTGVITGAELQRVKQHVPQNHASAWAQIIETAGNYAASLGVTSVQDVHSDDLYELLLKLTEQGKLKVRVYDCIGIGERKKAIAAGLRAAQGTPMVRRGCVKGMADGDTVEVEELQREVAEADAAGLQVMVHAIGQRSNANILTAFEGVIAANGKRDRRFRVEHAARMNGSDTPRFARSGIVASMQPQLFYSGALSGDDYRRIFDASTPVAFGSDSSMIDLDPMPGIHAAVNSGPRSITVEEAVRAYTIGSAYAEFQEGIKGTLEVGKLADFVILSEDIFDIDPMKIRDAKVLTTVFDGKVVFENK